MKKLSVPAIFSHTYLEALFTLNNKAGNNIKITEIYGSLPMGPIGTIRPSDSLPQISKNTLLTFIKNAKDKGIEFNYTMNSTILDGTEYCSDSKKELKNFIEEMVEAGLSNITVSAPFLITFIRNHFPTLQVTASICMEINSPQKMADLEAIGTTCVVLPKDVNRDFLLLNKIRNSSNLNIKVLCTTPCLFKCNDLMTHMNLSAIRDNNLKKAYKIDKPFLPYPVIRCTKRKLLNLEEHIKSPWIRPEDIDYYYNIGIEEFKIDGRDKSEEYNLEVISAYMNESYDGNLLYLMQNYYPKSLEEIEPSSDKNNTLEKIELFIDNKKLDGFLKPFAEQKINCDNGCVTCSYCKNWSEKTITKNSENIHNFLSFFQDEENKLISDI